MLRSVSRGRSPREDQPIHIDECYSRSAENANSLTARLLSFLPDHHRRRVPLCHPPSSKHIPNAVSDSR